MTAAQLPPNLASLLIAWAQHEALGRLSFSEEVPAELRAQLQEPTLRAHIAQGTGEGVRVALDLLFQVRRPMLAMLFAAEPLHVVEVAVPEGDIARVGWLELAFAPETPAFDPCAASMQAVDHLDAAVGVRGDTEDASANRIGALSERACVVIERPTREVGVPLPISVIVTARQSWWEDPS